MTNFIVLKLLENGTPLQQVQLVDALQRHQGEMALNQFGFIVLSKVVEHMEVALAFPLAHKLLGDQALFEAAVTQPNASLLLQNVLDSQ